MVIFAVVITFLIVCLEVLTSNRKLDINGEVFLLSRDLTDFRISTTTVYSLMLTNGLIIHQTTSQQGEIHQNCIIFDCTPDLSANHFFTFCNISIQDDICWNVTSIWPGRFIGGITRRSFTGGLRSFDIFHSIPATSRRLSLRVFEKRRRKPYSSSCVDIKVDAVVVKRSGECKRFICRLLLRGYFSKINLDAKTVPISTKKGNLKLTFILSSEGMTYVHYMEKRYLQPFKVPNHIKATMKRKLLYLRSYPVTEDHTKRREIDYFESQMSKKYINLLSFVNKYLTYIPAKKFSNRERIKREYRHKTLNYLKGKSKPLDKENEYGLIQNTHRKEVLHDRKILTRVLKGKGPSSQNIKRSKNSLESKSKFLNRRRRGIATSKDDSSLLLKVRFSLEKRILAAEEANEEFKNHLKLQLAKRMRVPLPCIQSMTIQSGNDISFILSKFNDKNNAMDDQSVFEAADFLKNEIKNQRLRLTDLNGQSLMTVRSAYVSMNDNTVNFSLVILIVLCVTLVILFAITIVILYIARKISRSPKTTKDPRNKAYRNMDFGRDSSQSVGKYSYDSGLWLGPGAEPIFEVPEAPYYRPPTVDQISSTPRPITAVRTRLKRNWNVDERALSTIPDDLGRAYLQRERNYH